MLKRDRTGRLAPKKFGTPNALTSLERATSEVSQEFWSEPVEVEEEAEDDCDEGIGYLRLAHVSMAWSGESQTLQRCTALYDASEMEQLHFPE